MSDTFMLGGQAHIVSISAFKIHVIVCWNWEFDTLKL